MATNGVVKNLVNHRRKKLELSLAREFQQKSHTHTRLKNIHTKTPGGKLFAINERQTKD